MSTSYENKTIGIDSDVFTCPICLERLRKPKYLPCLHTFCESCLNTYILSKHTDDNSSDSFSCPVCRQRVESPDANSPIEEWAKLMPLNYLIYSLMGNARTAENKDHILCEPCERDDETSTAVFWCTGCSERFCETCKKFHKRFVSASHRVIAIEEAQGQVRKIPDADEPCPKHKEEVLKVYCVDHHEMCCVICLAVNHRECKDIKTFEEMAKKLKNYSGISKLVKRMTEIGSTVETLRVKKQEHMNDIQQQKEKIFEKVSKVIDKAKQKLDKRYEDFKTEFSQIHKEQCLKLSDSTEKLKNFQKTLTNGENMLKIVSEYGSSKHLFVTSEKLTIQLDVQGKELKMYLKDEQDMNYDVIIDDHLAAIAEVMTSVAKIKLKPTLADQSFASVIDHLTLHEELVSANIEDLTAVKIWEVKGKGKCKGGVFLNDEVLLCSDSKSKTLTLYDNSGKVLQSHGLKFEPGGVVQNSAGNILVSNQTSKSIKVYSLLNLQFSEVQNIPVADNPRAIQVLKEYILTDSWNDINIMTTEGKLVRKVRTSDWNSYIAPSTSLNKEPGFYYCDGKDVVCQSLEGKELLRHSIQNLNGARGIALDAGNNIYVCGMDSKNVLVVSNNGTSDRILLSNPFDTERPYVIGFNKSGTEFFVTSLDSGSVAVYQLKKI